MSKKDKPHTSPAKDSPESSQRPRKPLYDRIRRTLAKFLTEELQETEDFQSAMEIMQVLVPLSETKKDDFHALGFNNKFLSEGRGKELYLASDNAPYYIVTFATDLYLDFADFYADILEALEDQFNCILDDEEKDPRQRFLTPFTKKYLADHMVYYTTVKKHLREVMESNKDSETICVRRDAIHDYALNLLSMVAIYQRMLDEALWGIDEDNDGYGDDDNEDEGNEGGNENGDATFFPFFPQDSKYSN